MKRILLIAIVLLLAACSASGSEFSRNQKTWDDTNISHYRFELNVSCFCAFRDKMPLSIEVKDGQIVSMTYVDGTQVSAEERAIFEPYSTLDTLFAYTAQQMKDADQITVKYDATYGFPVEVNIDAIQNAADDELYLSVAGFEKLP